MRAPSVELLRALRHSINHNVVTTTTFQPLHCRIFLNPPRLRDCHSRCLTTTAFLRNAARAPNPYAPTHRDRGPKSTEDTQTDFGAMDVLGNITAPATSVDACTTDGFHLDNGVKTDGGSGILLMGGEAFIWEPWRTLPPPSSSGDDAAGGGQGPRLAEAKLSDLLDIRRGTLSLPKESLGLLEMLHPKPDLLIVGTGGKLWMLSQETRKYINEGLGCRLDVMDTANASAAYNLLAKERGIEGAGGVGALLLPIGWVGPRIAGARR